MYILQYSQVSLYITVNYSMRIIIEMEHWLFVELTNDPLK